MSIALASEKYLSFTTFKRDGSPKPTAIWIADLGDGTMGFTTGSSSWKVKRLANNPNVVLQPSDSKGNPTEGSTPVEGTAVVVTGADFERVSGLIKAKYGIQFQIMKIGAKIMGLLGKGGMGDCAIIVTVP